MPTTAQPGISPIHPTLPTPINKNAAFPQTTIQTTVKPSVFPKCSQIDNQTFKTKTTSRQTNKQKTSNRNFSDHYYNFFAKSKTTKPHHKNSQNQSQSQNYNQSLPQQASHIVFFNDQPRTTLDRSKNYPFFQQNKKNDKQTP